MKEIDAEMMSLTTQVTLAKKDNSQISPGLQKAISGLKAKQENVMVSLELWKCMLRVYPNYNR